MRISVYLMFDNQVWNIWYSHKNFVLPLQDTLSVNSELSNSNDSLSENNHSKVK